MELLNDFFEDDLQIPCLDEAPTIWYPVNEWSRYVEEMRRTVLDRNFRNKARSTPSVAGYGWLAREYRDRKAESTGAAPLNLVSLDRLLA